METYSHKGEPVDKTEATKVALLASDAGNKNIHDRRSFLQGAFASAALALIGCKNNPEKISDPEGVAETRDAIAAFERDAILEEIFPHFYGLPENRGSLLHTPLIEETIKILSQKWRCNKVDIEIGEGWSDCDGGYVFTAQYSGICFELSIIPPNSMNKEYIKSDFLISTKTLRRNEEGFFAEDMNLKKIVGDRYVPYKFWEKTRYEDDKPFQLSDRESVPQVRTKQMLISVKDIEGINRELTTFDHATNIVSSRFLRETSDGSIDYATREVQRPLEREDDDGWYFSYRYCSPKGPIIYPTVEN